MKFAFKYTCCVCILLLYVLSAPAASAKEKTDASVFSMKQEKIVGAIPYTPALQQSVLKLLQDGPSVYSGLTLNVQTGLVIHMSYPTSIQIPHTLYTRKIREIYLYLEQNTKPKAVLLLDSNHSRIMIVELNSSADKFIKSNKLSREWKAEYKDNPDIE